MYYPLASIVLWLPLLGAGALLCLGREKKTLMKTAALAIALAECALCLVLYRLFQTDGATMQFMEQVDWIPRLGIAYRLGLDGLSLWLVLSAALLTLVALLVGWESQGPRVKQDLVCLLLLEGALMGMFMALDAVLFCVFCQGALVPMGWLVASGAESGRRSAIALKGLLFWLAASAVMLLAFLFCGVLYHDLTGGYSFDCLAWQSLLFSYPAQVGLLWALSSAFALRIPLVPVHTWLGAAQRSSSPSARILLAGVFLNAGAYGFIRFVLPLAPAAASSFTAVTAFSVLAVIEILYGALLMIGHADMRKVVAYFSLIQMGYIMLGLFSFNRYGMTGSAFLLVSQGLVAAAMAIITRMRNVQDDTHAAEENTETASTPGWRTMLLIVLCACIGLPGLSTFVGTFLVLLGVFRTNPLYAVFAALGSILTAAAMVRVGRVLIEEANGVQPRRFRNTQVRDLLALVPLVLLIVWMGLYPSFFLKPLEAPVRSLIARVDMVRAGPADLAPPGAFPHADAMSPHGERIVP